MPQSQYLPVTDSKVLAWFRQRKRELGGTVPLAEEVGIGRNTMTDFLLGNREPNKRTLPKLEAYVARHIAEIMGMDTSGHARHVIQGRAIEVSALLAYAQERLKLLTDPDVQERPDIGEETDINPRHPLVRTRVPEPTPEESALAQTALVTRNVAAAAARRGESAKKSAAQSRPPSGRRKR